MDNNFNAFASNPRYSPEGLESEIEREELNEARKVDTQQAAQKELDEMAAPDLTQVEAEGEQLKTERAESLERDKMIQMHEKILGVVDTATRIPRDVAGGLQKATNSALSLIVGRENLDAGNQWMQENYPGLVKFTSDYEKGIAPEGTTSEVTQELVRFMGPFGVYMKGIGAISKTGTFTKAFVADVLASGTALDPHMERLSKLVKSAGIENEFIGWMADNENETESEGRLKNMIEGSGLGLAVQATIVPVMMTMKGLYRGSKAVVKQVKTVKKAKPIKTKAKARAKPKEKVVKPKEDDISKQIKDLLSAAEAL